jgi:2-(1,2-epoxy-1,2-dihydrophenyl)acetyl-CoA isomerase
MTDSILVEHSGDVTILRLNNPAALNAMDCVMAETLTERLREARTGARAILLTGAGRAFCAGVDLASSGPPADGDHDAGLALESAFNPLMETIKISPVPILSAVRGAAAGVGASIALACDLIVAGEGAYFLQAFRRIGLVPDGGSALLLAHSIGRARAMELMLLGERLPAPTALAWGLINRVVPDDAVEETALALATDLARGPTRALGLIRQAAWAALSNPFEQQLRLERTLQREAGHSPDFAEGVAAFLEKRPAQFSGQ